MPEFLSVLPGLITGLAAGGYGVVLALFINNKRFRRFYHLVSLFFLSICLGLISYGLYLKDQGGAEKVVDDFVFAGSLGSFIILIIFLVVKKMKLLN